MTSGVPQDSVWGLVLFIVCVNDLPDVLQDDTKLYKEYTALKGVT